MVIHTDQAWVTLVTNDSYGLGALVLGHSLRKTKTRRVLHCMVAPGVSKDMRTNLNYVYDVVTDVDVMDSGDTEKLHLIQRPDLGITFTKLHCWKLTQYKKCVFVDADCMVIQNSDELFDYPELSAAPDIGWPDIFNSGVFVFEPSESTYKNIITMAITEGSFDGRAHRRYPIVLIVENLGGDQGILNAYFYEWLTKGPSHRLPFVYNTASSALYTYIAALRRFGKDVKIVHFLGSTKPWMLLTDENLARSVQPDKPESEFMMKWLQLFGERVLPSLDPSYFPKEMKQILKHNRSACECAVCRWCPNYGYLKHVTFFPNIFRVTVGVDAFNSIRPQTVEEVLRMLRPIRDPHDIYRLETPTSSFRESPEKKSEDETPADTSTATKVAATPADNKPGDGGVIQMIKFPFKLLAVTKYMSFRVSLAKWTREKLITKPQLNSTPLYIEPSCLQEEIVYEERRKSAPAVLGFRRVDPEPDPDLPDERTRKFHVRRRSVEKLRHASEDCGSSKPLSAVYKMFVPLDESTAYAQAEEAHTKRRQRKPSSLKQNKTDNLSNSTPSPGGPPSAGTLHSDRPFVRPFGEWAKQRRPFFTNNKNMAGILQGKLSRKESVHGKHVRKCSFFARKHEWECLMMKTSDKALFHLLQAQTVREIVPSGSAISDDERQRAWEEGVVDYTGHDSWENIQKRLDKSLQGDTQ
ncbi:glycosyltransferase, family 8 [Trichuris suis]|nr:glycosyltransferase, family 8 [Trichuris suis]